MQSGGSSPGPPRYKFRVRSKNEEAKDSALGGHLLERETRVTMNKEGREDMRGSTRLKKADWREKGENVLILVKKAEVSPRMVVRRDWGRGRQR